MPLLPKRPRPLQKAAPSKVSACASSPPAATPLQLWLSRLLVLVLIVCAGLAGHYAGSLQASVPPVPAHGVAPMPTEEALAPTTPAEVHSSMPLAPGCRLAIVVQGPAAGGLPANKGEQRNYVGLFAHGQPPPAWSLPEGVLRVPFDFSGVLRIFSTWYTTNPQELELIEAYRAAGFHIALSNLTEARDKFTDGGLMPTAATGRSTLNFKFSRRTRALRSQGSWAPHTR